MSTNYVSTLDDVSTVIGSLGRQNTALQLTQSYRGMVLSQEVSILDVYTDCATFQASKIRMCAILEGLVYLHCSLFPRPVAARLKCLNVGKGMFVLSDFVYSDAEWKERQHERVRPKEPTYISLHYKGKALRAPLVDISLSGMGILACKGNFEKEVKIQPGSSVRLDFQLPPAYLFPALKGTVIYLQGIDRSVAKSGLRLYPKAKEARSLEKYIAQRKDEIMQEIDQAYLELSKPWGPESQDS